MKGFYLFCVFVLFSSLVFSQKKDTPRSGEGVYEFLRRNNRTDEKHYEEFIQLNKNKLSNSNTLLFGVTYLLPPVSDQPKKENQNQKIRTGIEPLFGEKHKVYEIKDDLLAGACFFLVSGHGGPDPGAIANVDGYTLCEDEYNYDIMLRLARCLLEHNATVHIIIQDAQDGIRDESYLKNGKRETCMKRPMPLSHVARLKQQTDEINHLSFKSKEKYQRAIFIHLDSRREKNPLDVFFYYQSVAENKKRSLQLARTMQETFRNFYVKHQPGRGYSGTVSTRSLYVLENTIPVSIYAELANMQNKNDQKRYILYENRQALANWLCAGFIKDFQSSSR